MSKGCFDDEQRALDVVDDDGGQEQEAYLASSAILSSVIK